MKQIKLVSKFVQSVALGFFIISGGVSTYAAIPRKEVNVGLSDVFVPPGTNSRTEAYVIVNGVFPNGCYQWKGAAVNHLDHFSHEIESKAMVSQGMCTMVLVPFTKEVRLGELDRGEHKLKFLNGDGTYIERIMTVN